MKAKNDWLKALQEANKNEETVPKGWKTKKQIAEEIGVPLSTIEKKIKKLFEEGKADKRQFKINVGSFVRATDHYRLK